MEVEENASTILDGRRRRRRRRRRGNVELKPPQPLSSAINSQELIIN